MLNIKVILSALIIGSLISSFAYAQVWPDAVDILAKVQKELHLNYDQTKQVKVIIEENIAKRRAIYPQLADGLTQAQSDPIEKELYQKLSEVLTPSQMSQWNTIVPGMLKQMYPPVIANNRDRS